MASYYQNDYGYRRGEPTAAPQFVTSRGVDDVSSVKIHETRGWRTHSPDDGDLPDDRSFCSRFKFAIWAIVAVVIVAAIIALSVTMVEVQKNKHSSEADGEEYTPPGVLVPSSPGAGSSPGGANPNIGEPPGAPPASDNDGTLEIMSNPPFPVPAGYTALWWDEFEGNALDTQWWNYDIGYGQQYGLWAWGNQEQEYYTSDPSNVQVSNGVLKITAQRQQTVMPDGYTFQYTSGRINTKGKLAVFGGMTTKDGRQWNNIRIEASLQAPQPTTGQWAAYWMLPIDLRYGVWASSGEIDIYEMKNDFSKNNMALHYGGPYPKYSERYNVYNPRPGGGSFSTEFTTATLDWSPTQITMSMNGVPQMTMKSSSVDPSNGWYTLSLNKGPNSPFDIPFYFILNLAVGGRYPGNATDTTVFPNTFSIDYIRVFGQ